MARARRTRGRGATQTLHVGATVGRPELAVRYHHSCYHYHLDISSLPSHSGPIGGSLGSICSARIYLGISGSESLLEHCKLRPQ